MENTNQNMNQPTSPVGGGNVMPEAPQSNPPVQNPPSGGENKSSVGPTVGIIIVVVIVVIGGLYFWGSQLSKRGLEPDEILNEPDAALNALENLGTSDDLSDIAAELDATDLEGLDDELSDIDSELNF